MCVCGVRGLQKRRWGVESAVHFAVEYVGVCMCASRNPKLHIFGRGGREMESRQRDIGREIRGLDILHMSEQFDDFDPCV